MSSSGSDEWIRDQLAKSQFFHARLHDWHLLETSLEIEAVKGENFAWNLSELGISEGAWNKLIHRGIKPVRVFAHPTVLSSIARSPGYYRMLSMVSQKSMGHVKVASGDFAAYELGTKMLAPEQALAVAKHLNSIISLLVEEDQIIDERELDIWRGMAAGTQAQGSWQNIKGQKAEAAIKDLLRLRMRERGLIAREIEINPPLTMRIELTDGRTVVFGSDPDVAIYTSHGPEQGERTIAAVVEVKGGIDVAGVHERHGATLKSLVRAKNANRNCVTILVLPEVSLTLSEREELAASHDIVGNWFTADDVLGNEEAGSDSSGCLACSLVDTGGDGMPSNSLSFGVKTAPQHTTYEAMQAVWRAADATPDFDHAWLFDHFIPLGPDPTGPQLEGWTLLGAFAAQTERIRLGLMVTGNTYRHPAVLANIGATVDVISHGRLEMGIGAGWNELEHQMYGMTLPPPGERIRRLGEACEVIKLLWTEPVANFEGRYYQLHDARCEPKPVQKPYPPFVIGGSGEQLTLRVVAREAQVWNFAGGPVEMFAHKSAVLDGYCAEVGRDPAAIARSIQQRVIYDDLAATREAILAYIAAGASHIVLNLTYPYPEGIVQRLAAEVVRPLREEHA